ncbi:serine protease 52 [Drosophila subpulchrella]|uniref:serine protease 52 n=1 Tax=Drosophila subpulchrella TaxID=1486046 RepID=UPI0018A146B1|nr:serine protease 52 [Drosophila subpulchrella]
MASLFVWILLSVLYLSHPGHSNFLDDSCGTSLLVPKIYRGKNAKPQATRWMASVFYSTQFVCGGTLIHKSFVLTAAHCVEHEGDLFVKLGAYNKALGTHKIRVSDAIRHREYRNMDYRNDIALLKLEPSVTFNENIRPICIYLDQGWGKQIWKFHAYGWGQTSEATESDILQTITLYRSDPEECKWLLGLNPKETQICARSSNNGDTCGGDSGGPLTSLLTDGMHNFETQFGIISLGTKHCKGLGIYTDVSDYVDWIARAVTTTLDMWLYKDCAGYNLESILRATIYIGYRQTGGVLIANRYVMTNAGTLPSNPYFLLVVVMNTRYRVQDIYTSKSGIALLKLQHQVMPIDGMKPICMFGTNYLQQHDQLGSYYIFGSTEYGYQYYYDVETVDTKKCANHVQKIIEPNQFCVRSNHWQSLVKPGDILAEKKIYYVLLGIVTYSANGLYVIENARTHTESIAKIII